MPRGVPHETVVKSEAVDGQGRKIETVYAIHDDEGNELATWLEGAVNLPMATPDWTAHDVPASPHRLGALVAIFCGGAAAGMAVAELIIHWH